MPFWCRVVHPCSCAVLKYAIMIHNGFEGATRVQSILAEEAILGGS